MSKDAPGLFWVAPFTPTALFHRREFRKAIEAYWMESLTWRLVESQDWPAEQTLIEDFFHARRDGYGFVTERGSKKLFIVPRGWSEPEWALGELDLIEGRWRHIGNFEPASPMWTLPDTPKPSLASSV